MSDPGAKFDDESRRDFLRLNLGVIARIETLEGRKKVEILDLSQGGARIRLLVDAEPFKECVLCWLSFDSYARVGRRNGNELALVFDFPLRPGVIKQTRNQAPGIWRNDSVYQGAIARVFVQGTYNT